jgi:alanine racemase
MEVDFGALAANYREVRRLVGPDKNIIASVKGNGYGLGIVEVVRVLERLGVYAVATGSFKDAHAIREAGIRVKIQMFPGNLPEGIKDLLRYDLIPSVYNMETVHAVSEAAQRPVSIFVKVDAGLGRLGIPIEEAEGFVREVAGLPNVVVEGIFTHLPFGTASGREWALPRLKRFDELVSRLKAAGIEIPVTQSIASAGIVCGTETRCNTVCTGHLLFGGLARVTPDLGDLSQFKPVLAAIKTHLIHVAHHRAQKAIGTGGHQVLKSGSTTGVVPIGLYDGYLKVVAGETAVMLLRGHRAPVLNVTQEYATLDLTAVEDPRLGEEVLVLGEDEGGRITIEEMARWFGGIPLNVLMSFNDRFPILQLDSNQI